MTPTTYYHHLTLCHPIYIPTTYTSSPTACTHHISPMYIPTTKIMTPITYPHHLTLCHPMYIPTLYAYIVTHRMYPPHIPIQCIYPPHICSTPTHIPTVYTSGSDVDDEDINEAQPAGRLLTFRRGCWRPRPWSRHCNLFGSTEAQQQIRYDQEAQAWYDVIQSTNIVSYANVQTDWDRPDSFMQSVMWC